MDKNVTVLRMFLFSEVIHVKLYDENALDKGIEDLRITCLMNDARLLCLK